MRPDIEKAALMGPLIKSNAFDTPKGMYRIDIRAYKDGIYFFKYRDGKLLEACNLNGKPRRPHDQT